MSDCKGLDAERCASRDGCVVVRAKRGAYCRKRATRRARVKSATRGSSGTRGRSRASSGSGSRVRVGHEAVRYYRGLGYTPRTSRRLAQSEYTGAGALKPSPERRVWRSFVRQMRQSGW